MIAIEGMEFYSYHGCFKEEKEIGTHFLIDFYFENDTKSAEKNDDLNETVSYLDIYQFIKKEMELNSNLLENVGRRIVDSILLEFDTINWVKVKIQKMNPPLGGKMKSVSFSLEEKRS